MKKNQNDGRFIERFDSYGDEFARWKRTTAIKGLVGVFELPETELLVSSERLLEAAGLQGYSVIQYGSQEDNTIDESVPVSGTGFTIAAKSPVGRVVPVVFVQSDIQSVRDGVRVVVDEREQGALEVSHAIRLAVLLHELGHAEDISKGINYDHAQRRIEFAPAEAYAHAFVCTQAKRNNYLLVLHIYLDNIERMAKSDDDAIRVGADLFLQKNDIAELRSWIVWRKSPAGRKKMIEQTGRSKEYYRSKG